MEQQLKLNRETGYYEATFTVRIEAEIFRRMLFTYAEEHHIDPTDLVAWEKAIAEVARAGKWMSHPRAQVAPVEEKAQLRQEAPGEPVPTKKIAASTKWLSAEDEQALWKRARELPVDEWKTLLEPLPTNGTKHDKQSIYYLRSAQRKSLEQLKKQLEPAPMERLAVVASAVNGSRIH